MKIVVLDGTALNPGDLSWEAVEALGPCTIHDRTQPEHVIERARGAGIVLTNKTVLGRDLIEQLPDLRFIGVLATGFNLVDIDAARERGIPVANVPAYGTRSVAQMTFALLLELTQHVGIHARTVQAGRWCESPDFTYWDQPLVELDGLTMGLIGYGRIGEATAGIARAFGMQVIAHDPGCRSEGIELVELDGLLRVSDIVSLHCPLTAGNRRMIDKRALSLVKPSAFFINTARGGLVDEQALADALNAGRLAGAGLDVLSEEPPQPDNPLLRAGNCLVTPHIAWATRAARARLMEITAGNIRAFLAGQPQNVVN